MQKIKLIVLFLSIAFALGQDNEDSFVAQQLRKDKKEVEKDNEAETGDTDERREMIEKWKSECFPHMQKANETLWRMESEGGLPGCFGSTIAPVFRAHAGPRRFRELKAHFKNMSDEEKQTWRNCWKEVAVVLKEKVGEFPPNCKELAKKIRRRRQN